MTRWRVRLIQPGERTPVEWVGAAEDGYEAQALAEAAHPGCSAVSGSELPDE